MVKESSQGIPVLIYWFIKSEMLTVIAPYIKIILTKSKVVGLINTYNKKKETVGLIISRTSKEVDRLLELLV